MVCQGIRKEVGVKLIGKVISYIITIILCIALGAGGATYFYIQRLSDADREIREYSDLIGAIGEYDKRIDSQVGIIGDSIEAVGRGVTEAKDIALRARSQSTSLTNTLKELVADFKEFAVRIRDMENDLNSLRNDNANLRKLIDSRPVRSD